VTGEGTGFRPRAGSLSIVFLFARDEPEEMVAQLAEIATGVRLPPAPPPEEPEYESEGELDPDAQFGITPAGVEFLNLMGVFTAWLRQCPAGPMNFEAVAYPAIDALLCGWASAAIHAFAAEPLTVPEACERVGVLPLEAIAIRVAAMDQHGLLEALPHGAEPRYAPSDWLRRGIAPILAAMRMDLRHSSAPAAPIAVADVEAVFQLALPLLRLPADAGGSCALAMQLDAEVSEDPVGVTVQVEEGRVVALEPGIDEDADALAIASAADWLETLIEFDVDRIETCGEGPLAGLLVDGLHGTLFGEPLRAVFGDPADW
jgi:hypothetical protein